MLHPQGFTALRGARRVARRLLSRETNQPEANMEIEREQTGIRILYTVLFVLVIHVVEFVLGLVILFGLGFALATRSAPPDRVRAFADRVLRYTVQVVQYLTYNRDAPPFPFDDFPHDRTEASSPTRP
jgi:hypothetical protein